ncbi:DUF1254 domain-containing protein [Kumtagia ephedrae]|uniref:DUF1254 domain-containing protein n=1 Tax=Kumtagia ephedrae TaxID=2116701 RepID=A0A2P7RLI4_9HYPH|nr:DUF1254 domain-containing protein [Mesorhizobium ephedrae]PSJ51079.1 DUF1254 domain-containing protein [Mesorhizobium ephedrae]
MARPAWKGVAYALAVGLVGAGIVHIVILLMIPSFSARDAWTRLSAASGLYEVARIDTGTGGAADPSAAAAACRFDLADGVVHVSAPSKVPFWSISVYDRDGTNLYSLNDRAAPDRLLDLVVLTPDQMIELRKDLPEEFAQSVLVELPLGEGIVVLRALAPDASWRPAVDAFLAEAACIPR